jgi:hypothetical protein
MSLRLSPRCQNKIRSSSDSRPGRSPTTIWQSSQRAELPGTALPPVVDDDLVHHIGERELDSTHRSVGDDEAAGLDPTRLEVRLGALEARCLDHHVGAAQAILPALADADRLSQVAL